MSDLNLTDKQKEVLSMLPDTRRSIANELDISVRAVRGRMESLEDEGYQFHRDEDYCWYVNTPDEDPWRVNSYEKAQATKDIHNTLTEMEQEVKEALNNANPVVDPYEPGGNTSTLVLPHSDSHVGAKVDSRSGVDYYSAEEAQENIVEYFDKGIQAGKERGDVEEVAVIFNGDHLDGEGIYPHQRHKQEDGLRDQLRKAGRTYIEQLLKISDTFPHVSVYMIPGNHGRLDHKSTTNADMMLYDFIETALSYSDADNIDITKSENGQFLNFQIRGWDIHSRHGQDYLNHVGTNSGQKRAMDWFMQYTYDMALRSHYHKVLWESIGDNIPVVMMGSTAPPSTFAESQGESGGLCGVYWFTTEDTLVEDFQPIYFD